MRLAEEGQGGHRHPSRRETELTRLAVSYSSRGTGTKISGKARVVLKTEQKNLENSRNITV